VEKIELEPPFEDSSEEGKSLLSPFFESLMERKKVLSPLLGKEGLEEEVLEKSPPLGALDDRKIVGEFIAKGGNQRLGFYDHTRESDHREMLLRGIFHFEQVGSLVESIFCFEVERKWRVREELDHFGPPLLFSPLQKGRRTDRMEK
jgi:hypothetical protein